MRPDPFFVDNENFPLLIDLYELTMAAAFFLNDINKEASFELYYRRLPPERSYILSAGLEQALDYICRLRFSDRQIEWLKSLEQFQNIDRAFFDYLANFRFSGEVWAVPEGIPLFPLEPFIRVTAPIIEAQLLETYLLSVVSVQSMVATKASRIVHAARGREVIDFGTRRAHGPQAGLLAARASYIGGCLGTSNVLAGKLGSIPVSGTAAHSYTMAFSNELEAFQAYYSFFPDSTVLLIDTYDTLEAAQKIKQVGSAVKGVRIDSGNLLEVSRAVRRILDSQDLHSVKIVASGDLNEYKIDELMKGGAPIDIFGVGTEMVTSYDAPAMSSVYKMVEATVGGVLKPTIKISPGKLSYPGKKQVYRFRENEYDSYDMVSLAEEPSPSAGIPLLGCYMRGGALVEALPDLHAIRNRTKQELKQLPEPLLELESADEYPIVFSERTKQLERETRKNIR